MMLRRPFQNIFVKISALAIVALLGCQKFNGQNSQSPTTGGNIEQTGGQQTAGGLPTKSPTGLQQQGGETQNGGYGVKISNRVVSLDLYLRGSHLDPYLSSEQNISLNEENQDIVRTALKEVASDGVTHTVLKKLSLLKEVTTQLKLGLNWEFMIRNMTDFKWILLPEASCLDVQDDNSPFEHKIQLAYREDRWIRFCKEYQEIDDTNKSALIMHEIVYASLKQKSRTRELVGLLYNQGIKNLESVRQELRDLSQHLVAHSRIDVLQGEIEIDQVFKIHPVFENNFVTSMKKHPCYGWGIAASGGRPAFWSVALGEKCKTGKVSGNQVWVFENTSPASSPLMDSQGRAVGATDPSGTKLVNLCTRQRTEVCTLKLVGGDWQVVYGFSDDGLSLINSVKTKNYKRALDLLDLGGDANEIDYENSDFSLLQYSYANSDLATFALLLKRGANPNVRPINFSGGLYYYMNFPETIVEDVLAGMKYAFLDPLISHPLQSKTPYQLAAYSIKQDSSAGPFAQTNRVQFIEYLAEAGFNLNPPVSCLECESLFSISLATSYTDIKGLHIPALLKSPTIDVNFARADGKGCPPLAAALERPMYLDMLLSRGADMDRSCNMDYTGLSSPVQKALSMGIEVVQPFLKYAKNRNLQTPEKKWDAYHSFKFSALSLAVFGRNVETVKVVLKSGANPNLLTSFKGFKNGANVSENESTPLMLAAYLGDLSILDALLAGGADPNLKVSGGKTALSFAKSLPHSSDLKEVIQRLQEVTTAQ